MSGIFVFFVLFFEGMSWKLMKQKTVDAKSRKLQLLAGGGELGWGKIWAAPLLQ
jgi:hypothetical protein